MDNWNYYSQIEEIIGYSFKHKFLLKQAFTRKSYSSEFGGCDNEQLEFYGDSALDYYFVRRMQRLYSKLKVDTNEFLSKSEAELTRIKANNVNKDNLAFCIDIMELSPYLRVGSCDVKNNAKESSSVKEDLFEAIIGAVAIDSNWDLQCVDKVCEGMLEISYFDDDYIWEVNEWASKLGYPDFCYQTREEINFCSGETFYKTYIDLNNIGKRFEGEGKSLISSKMDVARKLYEYMYKDILIYLVGKPGERNPVQQLNELNMKGYSSEPKYEFKQTVEDGDIRWECKCFINNGNVCYNGKASSKKEAKQEAALTAIEDILERFN